MTEWRFFGTVGRVIAKSPRGDFLGIFGGSFSAQNAKNPKSPKKGSPRDIKFKAIWRSLPGGVGRNPSGIKLLIPSPWRLGWSLRLFAL